MQPPSETPDLSRKNEELQQAMELPIKGAGIATLHLLQKSLGGWVKLHQQSQKI